jgi:hypothetical protein
VTQEEKVEENLPLLGTLKIISGPGDEVQPPELSKQRTSVWSYVPKIDSNILFYICFTIEKSSIYSI